MAGATAANAGAVGARRGSHFDARGIVHHEPRPRCGQDEHGPDEERRTTRARRRLYMTWARERSLFGRSERNADDLTLTASSWRSCAPAVPNDARPMHAVMAQRVRFMTFSSEGVRRTILDCDRTNIDCGGSLAPQKVGAFAGLDAESPSAVSPVRDEYDETTQVRVKSWRS